MEKEALPVELQHVAGRTYVAAAQTALLGVYRVTDRDVILLDTGYARLDRSALSALIDQQGWRLRGILCSHAHFDHTGNVRYLQQRCGAQAAISLIEAGISVNPESYRANYVALTYGKSRDLFLEECFTADTIIPPDARELDFCGAHFAVLALPGHTAGHTGFITPDNVAYVGDCLISQRMIDTAKLPTSMYIARDIESKNALRDLHCNAYILAHKEVTADLAPLIDSNIAFIYDKAAQLLDCLDDGMMLSQWMASFCRMEDIHTHNELKFSIIERNFANFAAWLTDEGRVTLQRQHCAKTYYHA